MSDIEGSTRLFHRLGSDYVPLLAEHRRLLRDAVARHAGHEVETEGDALLLAFSDAADAFAAALDGQRALAAHAWPAGGDVRVRMGLHTGEAIRDADDFLGSTVNLASRIATAARGGEILVSGLLKELCASSGEFDFDRGQEIELKGLSQPHRVYAVTWS
jgi:class 3 adenylate cyclase